MRVTQVVPEERTAELEELLSGFTHEARPHLQPFAPELLSFVDGLSRAVFRDANARRYPELQALAFWMRRADMTRLDQAFRALGTPELVLAPRGLVYHIPPSNVDTIFLYSWLLAMLTGNCNIIRISTRAAGAASVLLRLVAETLQTAPDDIRRSVLMIRYDHNPQITERISSSCDMRVIWGGDRTIDNIRRASLPPHAVELTFPDRYSIAAISASGYLASTEETRRALAHNFYNDVYWFDQNACSSPRFLLWCGADAAEAEQCSRAFFASLKDEICAAGYALEAGHRVNKLTFAFRAALDEPVVGYRSFGSECSVLCLDQIRSLAVEHCGGGLLFQGHLSSIVEIAGLVTRKCQTLTHFGFEHDELLALARQLNDRGIDRIVPIGQALAFSRYWDGNDLLRSFTRLVNVVSS